jgi:hypothetical protein
VRLWRAVEGEAVNGDAVAEEQAQTNGDGKKGGVFETDTLPPNPSPEA